MATSLEDIDQLELLEADREVRFRNKMYDVFGNEEGLHNYFHRNENNGDFIADLIGLEHKLDATRIFDESRDTDGFVNSQKVVDELLKIFNEAGKMLEQTKDVVFEEANLSREQFMANLQRGIIDVVRMFDDSQFQAEEHFLGGISSHYVVNFSKGRTKTLPPSALDLKPLSEPKPGSTANVAIKTATELLAETLGPEETPPKSRKITLSFERHHAIREMLDSMGLEKTINNFPEEQFFMAIIPEVAKFIELTVRRNAKKWIIRQTAAKDLEALIEKTFVSITSAIQDELVSEENRDKVISQIIFSFYRPGKDKLRSEFEKKIKEEVSAYFHAVHKTPPTVIPKRIKTQIPQSGVAIPAAPLPPAAPPMLFHKTLPPETFTAGVDDLVADTRSSLVTAPVLDFQNDAGSIEDATTAVNLDPDSMDDAETTVEAPTPNLILQSIPQEPFISAPENQQAPGVSTRTQRALPSIYEEPNDWNQKLGGNIPPIQPPTTSSPGILPPPRPIEEMPLPPASRELMRSAPVIKFGNNISEKSVLQPPKKHSGFFAKARRWMVGGVMAAAAAMGVYAATQTRSANTNDETTQVASTNTASNNTPPSANLMSTAPTTPPTASTSNPMDLNPNPVPDVKDPTVVQPKVDPAPTKPVGEVLAAATKDPRLMQILSRGELKLKADFGGYSSQMSAPFYNGATPAELEQIKDLHQKINRGAYASYMKRFGDLSNTEFHRILSDSSDSRHNLLKSVVRLIGTRDQWSRKIGGMNYEDKYPDELKYYEEKFEGEFLAAGLDARSPGNIHMGGWGNDVVKMRLPSGESNVTLAGGQSLKYASGGEYLSYIRDLAAIRGWVLPSGSATPAPGPGTVDPTPTTPKGTDIQNPQPTNPTPAPSIDPKHGSDDFLQNSAPLKYGFIDDEEMKSIDAGWDLPAKAQTVRPNPFAINDAEMKAVDEGWDTIAEEHALKAEKKKVLRAELNAKVEKLFAKASPVKAQEEIIELDESDFIEVTHHTHEEIDVDISAFNEVASHEYFRQDLQQIVS